MTSLVTCRYCSRMHSPTFLCPVGRRVLDALAAKGMQFDLPELEFPEPVMAAASDVADVLCRQITVAAALIPSDDDSVFWPAVVLSGRSVEGPLPRWLYGGSPGELRRLSGLVNDMVELAIRRAGP